MEENKNSPVVQNNNIQSVTNEIVEATKKNVMEKDIADSIMNRVMELEKQGSLVMPLNYNAGNALKEAMLIINNDNDLLKCNKSSIANALLETVLQGLSPAKKQCYYIAYNNQCTLSRSYFGDVAVCKHTGIIKDVYARCIYEDDIVTYGFDEETGRETITSHESNLLNHDKPIIGAYACAVGVNGKKVYELMTYKEIQTAWSMSKAKQAGKKTYHYNFPQEACKKTVIRRLVKMIFNSSTNIEANSIVDSYIRTTENEYNNESSMQQISNKDFEHDNINEMNEAVSEKIASEELPDMDFVD